MKLYVEAGIVLKAVSVAAIALFSVKKKDFFAKKPIKDDDIDNLILPFGIFK